MAEQIKNFGIIGIGGNVQLGKGGARLRSNVGVIEARHATDDAFVIVRGADPVADDDLVTLRELTSTISGAVTTLDGMDVPLGTPGDGSLTAGGAIPFLTSDKVTDAIDGLNEILGMLVPAQPPAWPNGVALSITGTSASLVNGAVPNNTGAALPAAGATVNTLFALTYSTNAVGGVGDLGSGPGTTGTITALENGVDVGSRVLTTGNDNGTYGNLVLSGHAAYPAATPGFWEVVTAQIAAGAAVPAGYNSAQITHSGAGNTNVVYWVADNLTPATPGVAGQTIAAPTTPTTTLSSTIPHYTNGQLLRVSATLNNVSGYVYRTTAPVTVAGVTGTGNGAPLVTTSYNFGAAGMPAIPGISATGLAATDLAVATANVHASGTATITHQNPRGTTGAQALTGTILVMGAATTAAVDEDNIGATGFTNSLGARVNMTGDAQSPTPAATFTATTADWAGNTALETFDATVVGGVLRHDQRNYTTGFLPPGPNLTTQSGGTQYATFMIRGVRSKFNITVAGTYTSCTVKLPGVSDADPAHYDGGASNGWWDMGVSYAGAGAPGNGTGSNGSVGCAETTRMLGTGGTFSCTFGTQTSSNSTNNIILVRIGLAAGQSLTALSFS